MNEYIGKRILITLGDNDAPQMTSVVSISPNCKYVYLSDYSAQAVCFGWTPIADVKVLDVLGGDDETMTVMHKRLKTTVVLGGLHG